MKELVKEFKRFVLVGIVSNALNFIIYAFLYKIGLMVWVAATLGYVAGLSNSFYFGKAWVFNNKRTKNKYAIIKFILIYCFGGICMVLIINTLDNITSMDFRMVWFFGALYAFINNYIGSKIFVFQK